MGEVLRVLSAIELPEREAHNSRLFIDLCENIHIHHREFRVVFSLDEYFEYVDIIKKSTEDVRNYLAQNPDYLEEKYPTTIMIAGGAIRQQKLLQNSPKPNQSAYFPNRFTIELQAESVIDEIHVHWRDFRFAMTREHFKIVAQQFELAKKELIDFESKNDYIRRTHHDRNIEDFEIERQKYASYDGIIQGEQEIDIHLVKSRFKDIFNEFKPNKKFIKVLIENFLSGDRVFPIILSTEKDSSHMIIDGNHRYYAALKANREKINCIITDITFEESNLFRKAESLLKEFDRQTNYKYNTSNFNKEFAAYKLGTFYRDHFYKALRPSLFLKFKRRSRIYIISLLKKAGLKAPLKKLFGFFGNRKV